MDRGDELEVVLQKGLTNDDLQDKRPLKEEIIETVMALQSLPLVPIRYVFSQIELIIPDNKLLPSVVQAPTLDLKTLPDHLKYAYVGDTKIVPINNDKRIVISPRKSCSGCLENTRLRMGGP